MTSTFHCRVYQQDPGGFEWQTYIASGYIFDCSQDCYYASQWCSKVVPGVLTVALFLNCGRPHLGLVGGQPQTIASIAIAGYLQGGSSGSGVQNSKFWLFSWLSCSKVQVLGGAGCVSLQALPRQQEQARPAILSAGGERPISTSPLSSDLICLASVTLKLLCCW